MVWPKTGPAMAGPPTTALYTARGESRVANIARGKAECYSCHQELYISYKQSSSALSVLLYFTLLMCE